MFHIIPFNTNVDFLRMRNVALVVSILLLIGSIALLATRGLNYALDFTGGTSAELLFEKPVDLEEIRAKLDEAGYQGATVQNFGSENDVVIRLQPRADQANAEQTGGAILEAVTTPDNPGQVISSDFVGPQVGKELAQNGILAVLFVLIGFVVYISIRFEWKFAVAAIVTTAFDVVVTTALFALTQREFDLTVMAGIMSVMGFSINDTIVVFDRVRENFRAANKFSSMEILNRSVNQTLSRTILTSVVALLTVTALYIYGGSSLEGMAESQIFGIILGTLSSIFVACPILYWLGTSKQDLIPKTRDEAELARRP
ncbi:MAG: protein translocase subunit SecF [Lysobacteraceae bacterium]